MILNDSMLSVAFRYRETNLWKELTDSDVFAVRLSTGEIGYCCVMGNAGEHNALALYIGDSGFSTYLKTIEMGDLDVMAAHEVIVTFNCINCDFANASGIMSHSKEIIKAYAESHGLKIRRSNGWPDFVRYSPYKMPWGITSEQDAQAITEALSASLDVSKMMKTHSFGELGFDVSGKYPTLEGGKTVPYLVPQSDGTYEWSLTKLPAFCQDVYPMPIFDNDVLVRKVKGLRKLDILQCRLVHLPASVQSETNEVPYFPTILLCVDENSEMLLPVTGTEEFGQKPENMLTEFANILCSANVYPAKIVVTDEQTKRLLDDFCRKCAIAIEQKFHLQELDDACSFLLSYMLE